MEICSVFSFLKFYVSSDYELQNVVIYTTSSSRIYQSQENNQRAIELDISTYQSGLYFIHIETEGGKLIEKVVIK